tara:strand:- start:8603 stop:9517 length:915 start_codon:yes stop_codon:yes gene_type:complete
MDQDSVEYASAADKRAKAVAGLSGGFLLILPNFINNFDAPHDGFWLLALCAALAAVSLVLATVAFMVADANNRRILLKKDTNWPKYHRVHGIATYSFAGAVILFAAFAVVNSSDFTDVSLKPVDITMDRAVVAPEETVELSVVSPNDFEPDSYRWSASAGILFDDNQKSVTWLSPPSIEESNWVEVTVLVQFGELEQSQSTRILYISPKVEKLKRSTSAAYIDPQLQTAAYGNSTRLGFESPCYIQEGTIPNSLRKALPRPIDELVSGIMLTQLTPIFPRPGLPGPRECCSESDKNYPFCDPSC